MSVPVETCRASRIVFVAENRKGAERNYEEGAGNDIVVENISWFPPQRFLGPIAGDLIASTFLC